MSFIIPYPNIVYLRSNLISYEQAKEEIKFACDNTLKIYGVNTKSFEYIWDKYGDDIVGNGFGNYLKIILFIAKKIK